MLRCGPPTGPWLRLRLRLRESAQLARGAQEAPPAGAATVAEGAQHPSR
jgi:hypothetical protein